MRIKKMPKLKWEKVYKGPFAKAEAEGLAQGLREIAKPAENLIYDAGIRRRPKSENYDVFIKTENI